MSRSVVVLASLLLASVASAQIAPTRVKALDLSDGSSLAVGPANKARFRYHLGNNRLEVSYNGAAYAALGGGGSGYSTIANNAVNLTARTLLNCDGTLVVCSDNGGATRTDITLGSVVMRKDQDNTLSAGVDIVGSSTSDITMRHYFGAGSAPTCVVGTGAGTGATCSVAGTDAAFEVTVNTGTGPAAGTALVVTVTYASTWGATPFIIVYPSNFSAGISGKDALVDRSSSSATTAALYVPFGVTLTASSTYTWVVHTFK